MNKKTVSKVNFFFGGLVSRMEENKDFFNDITINLKSGTKNFFEAICPEFHACLQV